MKKVHCVPHKLFESNSSTTHMRRCLAGLNRNTEVLDFNLANLIFEVKHII